MKKILSCLLFMLPVVAFGETNSGMYGASSVDLTGGPGTRDVQNVNYKKYETRTTASTYSTRGDKNIYYTQPTKRTTTYSSAPVRYETTRTTRTETVRNETKRKYYLAHPFFQPTDGKFGSITEFSYGSNSYDIAFTPGILSDDFAAFDATRMVIKEDLSFGITDRFAILGMVQYDKSEYELDWSLPETPDDKNDESGINLYGLGLQWRFVDNAEWIATLSGYFQHQKDIANNFIIDVKAGYKFGRSTVYGLARGWYVDIDGNSYGTGISDDNGTSLFIAHNSDASSALYIEAGAGVFSVLGQDWTLNGELVFGDYDWHNQLSGKFAIGWQPGNSFALNLYGKIALTDSADGKDLDFWWIEPTNNINEWTYGGKATLENYAEWMAGIQAILYF